MGGGTFDAAVIHLKDGIIQVVNHGGDNDLGGKLIDWAIVDQLFVPMLVQPHIEQVRTSYACASSTCFRVGSLSID